MAHIAMFAMEMVKDHLSLQEGLSGVFGSVSLATWIFLLVSDHGRVNESKGTGMAQASSLGH